MMIRLATNNHPKGNTETRADNGSQEATAAPVAPVMADIVPGHPIPAAPVPAGDPTPGIGQTAPTAKYNGADLLMLTRMTMGTFRNHPGTAITSRITGGRPIAARKDTGSVPQAHRHSGWPLPTQKKKTSQAGSNWGIPACCEIAAQYHSRHI